MKIIQEGNPNKELKTYRFECRCGCVFECDKNEVQIVNGRYNELHAKHECPTCGKVLYVDD